MKTNRIRVESTEDIIQNAGVWVRDDDDNWVDIRHCVSAIRVDLKVGSVGVTHLDLLPPDVLVQAGLVTPETEVAFADVLRAAGWKVERQVPA